MNQAIDMSSMFTKPDLKKTTSFRLPESVRQKIERTVALWRETARLEGCSEAEVSAIDNSYVMVTLMARGADSELAQFGGMPETSEQAENQMKALRTAFKKTSR